MDIEDRSVQRDIEATRAPLHRAFNLPGFCYTSPEWYAREMECIFRKEWIYVGHHGQLASAGDYYTAQVGDEPILIVRGEDNEPRAFSNVCRHRASLVASGEGQCRAFVCPYHRWTYGLCGELLGTPGRRDPMSEAEGFEREHSGLVSVRLERWAGFLFVNFDAAAPPLLDWLGELPFKLQNYRLEDMTVTRRVSWSVECNWKVFMENSIEEYHVETLHRKHLPRDNPNLVVVEESRGPFALRFTPASITAKGSPFPPMPGLSEKERTGTYPLALFPNTNLIVGNHFAKVLQHLPNAVERCTMTLSFLFPPDVVRQPEFAAYSEQAYRYTDELLAEDTSLSPQVQQGLRSSLRRPGRFSRQEGAVHTFQNYLLGRVLDAEDGPPTTEG
jgi:choline monooxygenase